MTNAELFEQTFGRYATEVWALPEDEFLEWLNADVHREAFDMAIKALEQQPCGDCISRAEAIRIASGYCAPQNIAKDLRELPSVTPQPKTGRWLDKEVNSDKVIDEWQSARCNVCDKYHTTPYMYYFSHYNYCPYCGVRMDEVQDD